MFFYSVLEEGEEEEIILKIMELLLHLEGKFRQSNAIRRYVLRHGVFDSKVKSQNSLKMSPRALCRFFWLALEPRDKV